MLSQEVQGIAFSIAHEQQRFHLLELPPSLLDLVTSETLSSLLLKSTPSSESNPGNAVLCTDKQTFQLRQVHSSNSVFVVDPLQGEGLTAIAKCEATLEAIPQSLSCIPWLKAVLPIYPNPEHAKFPLPGEAKSKQSILADTPISAHAFSQAWTALCAFELEGQACCPAPGMLWKVWRSIVSACTIKGWSLDQLSDIDSLARTLEENDIPIPILNAVIDRIRGDEGVAEEGHARIDVTKCIFWTGTVRLQASPGEASILAVSDFLGDWRDHLPESWRKHATLDALTGSYIQPSKDTISFDESGATTVKGIPSAAQAKDTGPQARKWHEKFKSTRR